MKKNKKKISTELQIDDLNKDQLYLYLNDEISRNGKGKSRKDLREAICVKYSNANEYDWFTEDEVRSLIDFTIANCIARVEFDRYMRIAKSSILKMIEINKEIKEHIKNNENVIQLDFVKMSEFKLKKVSISREIKEMSIEIEKLNKFEKCTKEDGKNPVRNKVLNKMFSLIEICINDIEYFEQSNIQIEELSCFDIWEKDHRILNLTEFKNYFFASIWNGVTKHYKKYVETNYDENGNMPIELSAYMHKGNFGETSNSTMGDSISMEDCLGLGGTNGDGMESVNSKLHTESKLELLYPLLKTNEREVLDDLIVEQLSIEEICLKRSYPYSKVQQIKRKIYEKINKMELFYDVA